MSDETMPIEFAPGLVIEMRLPTEEQAGVAYTTLLSAEKDPTRYARALAVYFKFVGALLVNPEDEDRLADAMLDKTVTFDMISNAIESVVGGLGATKAKAAPTKRTRTAKR